MAYNNGLRVVIVVRVVAVVAAIHSSRGRRNRWRQRKFWYYRHGRSISPGFGTRNDNPRILSIPIFPTPPSLHLLQKLQYLIWCLPSSFRSGVCFAMRLLPYWSIVPKTTISIFRISSVTCPAYPPLPYPFSHIYGTAVPIVLHIHHRKFLPPVSTSEIVCHTHYPESLPLLHCHPTAFLLRSSLHYLPLSRELRRRRLSALSARIFSSLCVVLHYTDQSALLRTNFLTLHSDLIITIFSSLLEGLFSLSVMFSLRSNLPRFLSTCLHPSLLQYDHYPQLCLLWYSCSISALLKSDCYDLLVSDLSGLLCI